MNKVLREKKKIIIIIIILIDFSCWSTVRACMTLSKTQASMNPFAIGRFHRANIQINNSVLKKGKSNLTAVVFLFCGGSTRTR